jgi:hybrid cluster-associated redox disulfide protein
VTGPEPPSAPAVERDTLIADVIDAYPASAPFFAERFHGDCATCAASEVETLADAARLHRIDIDALMRDVHERLPAWAAENPDRSDADAGGDDPSAGGGEA